MEPHFVRQRAEQLNQLKQILRSLVESNGNRLSIRSLIKEYRDTTESEIPVASLGYHSVLELIQDLDDTFGIERSDSHRNESEFIVFCLHHKDTQHLVDLIQNQRHREDNDKSVLQPSLRLNPFRFTPNTSQRPKLIKPFELKLETIEENKSLNSRPNGPHFGPYGRSVRPKSVFKPVCPLPDTRIISNDEKNNISKLLSHYKAISLTNFRIVYRVFFNRPFDLKRFGFATIDQFLSAIPDVVTLKRTNDGLRVCSAVTNGHIGGNGQSAQNSTKADKCSKSAQLNASKDKELANIRSLLRKHPNGIKVNHFCDLYYNAYKKQFLSDFFGYGSAIEMFAKMRDLFYLKKVDHPMGTNDNWLLLESTPELMAAVDTASEYKKGFTAQFKDNVTELMLKISAMPAKQLNVEDFQSAYDLMFDEDIDPKKYGFETLTKLLTALSRECDIDVRERVRNKPYIVYAKKY